MPNSIDTTMMYVVHNAFLRDLDALTAVTAPSPAVMASWGRFKTYLHIHHTAEDTHLWPQLRRSLAGQPDGVAVLDDMETEHVGLTTLLAAVDSALTAAAPVHSWVDQAQQLSDALSEHCEHEEKMALPLITELLSDAEWAAFGAEQRRALGRGGASAFLPWLLDGSAPDAQQLVLGLLPAPVRILYRRVWRPRYLRRPRWEIR
jgi:hypothetical protein